MNVSLSNLPGLSGVIMFWGIAVSIFWMVVAYRAMKALERASTAHERLASAMERRG